MKKTNRKKICTTLIIGGLLPALAISLIFLFSNNCSSSKRLPNVVVVVIDTLRADHSSLYGYKQDTMPNLRRIAKEGLTLQNYFVNAPWTKPSVASIITGLYPTAHGSRIGQFEDLSSRFGPPVVEVLNSEIDTMAEILKKNGFLTHAFITNFHLTPVFGYAQGYDHYHFDDTGSDKPVVCRKDREMLRETAKLLEEQKGKGEPLFIYCHLMAVHGYCYGKGFNKYHPESSTPIPSDAPQVELVLERFDTVEEIICAYDNSIAYTDFIVGELFNTIKSKAPDTIFIVTSDHGEEFLEHGGFEHCRTLYNELLKVPCVIWGPSVPTGVFSGLADSIDLLPTILKNLDIPIEKHLRGQPLFYRNKIIADKDKDVFAEQHNRGDFKRFALIWQSQKLILNRSKLDRDESIEFYDNGLDIENKNIHALMDQRTIKRYLRRITRYWKMSIAHFRNNVGHPSFKKITTRDFERLRSLGYIR
jgi:arylsulfatase A-like enzyme